MTRRRPAHTAKTNGLPVSSSHSSARSSTYAKAALRDRRSAAIADDDRAARAVDAARRSSAGGRASYLGSPRVRAPLAQEDAAPATTEVRDD